MSTIQFVVSHLFSRLGLMVDQMRRFLPCQPLLRIWALLTVLLLTLREQVSAPVRWRRKSTKCSFNSRSCHYPCKVCPGSKIASRRSPRQWHICSAKITNVEQIVSSLAARVAALETISASLILSQALMMNMHEVPCCYIFRVNKSTLECLLGSVNCGQRPTHQLSASRPENIAK